MSCGCNKATAPNVTLTIDRGQHRARYIQCATCTHATGDLATDARCGYDGKPLRQRVLGEDACPLGRHPDERGIVRDAWGDEWAGVPAPTRWTYPLVRRWLGLPPLTGALPGCGCFVPAKTDWLRFAAEHPATARVIRAVRDFLLRRRKGTHGSVAPNAYGHPLPALPHVGRPRLTVLPSLWPDNRGPDQKS